MTNILIVVHGDEDSGKKTSGEEDENNHDIDLLGYDFDDAS